MNCDRCGENPAAVHYTELRDGRSEELEICEACAEELGFDTPSPTDPKEAPVLKGKLLGVVSIKATLATAEVEPGPEEDTRYCPVCGLTGRQLAKQPLFGCANCYEVFENSLDDLFQRIHGAVGHRGRLPGGAFAVPVDVPGLRRALAAAVSDEDYEEAARLRDELRRADPSFDSREADRSPPRESGEKG